MRRSPCRALWQGKKERTDMSTEQQIDVSLSATPPLSEILDAHAKLETQVGEIYITFAATFGHNPELRAL